MSLLFFIGVKAPKNSLATFFHEYFLAKSMQELEFTLIAFSIA